jgi:hypothetical protein
MCRCRELLLGEPVSIAGGHAFFALMCRCRELFCAVASFAPGSPAHTRVRLLVLEHADVVVALPPVAAEGGVGGRVRQGDEDWRGAGTHRSESSAASSMKGLRVAVSIAFHLSPMCAPMAP